MNDKSPEEFSDLCLDAYRRTHLWPCPWLFLNWQVLPSKQRRLRGCGLGALALDFGLKPKDNNNAGHICDWINRTFGRSFAAAFSAGFSTGFNCFRCRPKDQDYGYEHGYVAGQKVFFWVRAMEDE